MQAFLSVALSLPTLLFTVPLALTMLYWALVLSGVLDLEIFDHLFHSADAALEGAAHAVADGAAEGAAHAAADGLAHGVAHGAADGAGHALDHGLVGALAALKLRSVPVTISGSFIALYGWAACYLGVRFLAPALPVPSFLGAIIVAVVALVLGTLAASVTVRPIGALLTADPARQRKDLIGHTAIISTGRVDERFGQATLEDGGAGMILQVRHDRKGDAAPLQRGHSALIVHFDEARDAFVVEPLPDPVSRGAETMRPAARIPVPPVRREADDH